MSRRPMKSAARPWDATGYVFYTDLMKRWLNGYEPTVAADMLRSRSAVRDSVNASVSRQTQMERGTGWGTGFISGLSAKSGQQLKGGAR